MSKVEECLGEATVGGRRRLTLRLAGGEIVLEEMREPGSLRMLLDAE